MATTEELIRQAQILPLSVESDEKCIIDPETREIEVPLTYQLLGVESDEKVERIEFQCPRIVGDNIDLSELQIRINFRNANQETDQYIVEDMIIYDENITFSWLLSRKVTAYQGTVNFVVCAVKIGESITNEWNTTLAQSEVLEGLEVDTPSPSEEQSDVIAQLLQIMKDTSDQAVKAVESAEEQAVKSVETIGTEQVQAVKAEGTTQIGAVQQKGQEVLDSIPEDYTNTVKNVDILERTKAPAILQTASGNPITLTDAGEGTPVVDFSVDGKTEQVQTTGAQLLDVDQFYSDFKQDDGIYYATNQDFNNIRIPVTSDMIGKEYTFSADVEIEPGGSLSYLVIIANISETNVYGDRTTDKAKLKVSGTIETENDYFAISYGAGTSNIKVKNIMFNSGSEALPYEPYTGGQPSPSQDYPQEIINAGKYNKETQKWEYEVILSGLNLVTAEEKEETWAGVNLKINNGKFTYTGTSTGSGGRTVLCTSPITLLPGKYTLSVDNTQDVSTYVSYYSGSKNAIAGIARSNVTKYVTFSIEEQTEVIIGINIETVKSYNGSVFVMLNRGDSPALYEAPRTPQTLTLQSDRPLTKWDRLEKRDGQWGWVYKSSIITIELIKMINLSNGNKGGVLSVSNKLLLSNTENFAENAIKNNTYKDGTYYENKENFVFCGTSSDTLETLKQKYDGADFVYQTAEETFVPLTDPEQSALEALTTYFPTTIIANDADCEIEIEYVADTKTYIDNKFAELQTALANTQAQIL